jgi:hypothetical protein
MQAARLAALARARGHAGRREGRRLAVEPGAVTGGAKWRPSSVRWVLVIPLTNDRAARESDVRTLPHPARTVLWLVALSRHPPLRVYRVGNGKAPCAGAFMVGREGFEPSTLGLRVDRAGFARFRVNSPNRTTKPSRFLWDRVRWGHPVDPLLTGRVARTDNTILHLRGVPLRGSASYGSARTRPRHGLS